MAGRIARGAGGHACGGSSNRAAGGRDLDVDFYGGQHGWLMPGVTTVASSAFACDVTMPFADWVEVRGEFFNGEGLPGLGGGGM